MSTIITALSHLVLSEPKSTICAMTRLPLQTSALIASYVPKIRRLSLEELTETYGSFYRVQAMEKVQSALKKIDDASWKPYKYTYEVAQDLSSIRVKYLTPVEERSLCRQLELKSSQVFFQCFQFIRSSRLCDDLTILLDAEPLFNPPRLLELAKCHPDPVSFLMHHLRYWGYKSREILELLSGEDNFEKPNVIDLFEAIILDSDMHCFKKEQNEAIRCLGKALASPSLKERAKAVLLKIAYTSEQAQEQLAAIIDEKDVAAFFKRVAAEYPRIADRFRVRNYLDRISHRKEECEVSLMQGILASFRLGGENRLLRSGEAMVLEDILWTCPKIAALALGEQGLSALGEIFLRQFSLEVQPHRVISYSWTPLGSGEIEDIPLATPLYSIAKFVGLYTKSQSLFSQILDHLLKECTYQEYDEKASRTTRQSRSLGYMQSLESVLGCFSENSHVKMPEHLPVEVNYSLIDVEDSPLPPMNRAKDFEEFEIKEIRAMVSFLRSNADPILKKIALREMAKYLFPEGSDVIRYKRYVAEEIASCMRSIIANDSTPDELRKEAAEMCAQSKIVLINTRLDLIQKSSEYQSL